MSRGVPGAAFAASSIRDTPPNGLDSRHGGKLRRHSPLRYARPLAHHGFAPATLGKVPIEKGNQGSLLTEVARRGLRLTTQRDRLSGVHVSGDDHRVDV